MSVGECVFVVDVVRANGAAIGVGERALLRASWSEVLQGAVKGVGAWRRARYSAGMSLARRLMVGSLCVCSLRARADARDARVRAAELEISAVPVYAEIRVDGLLVEPGTPLQLSVGPHAIELRAQGFVPRVISFDAREDEHVGLAVTLERDATHEDLAAFVNEPEGTLHSQLSLEPMEAARPRTPTGSTEAAPPQTPSEPTNLARRLPASEPTNSVKSQVTSESNSRVAASLSWSAAADAQPREPPMLCTTQPQREPPRRTWLWTGLALAASALALTLGFTLTHHPTSTLPPISTTPVAIRPGP